MTEVFQTWFLDEFEANLPLPSLKKTGNDQQFFSEPTTQVTPAAIATRDAAFLPPPFFLTRRAALVATTRASDSTGDAAPTRAANEHNTHAEVG